MNHNDDERVQLLLKRSLQPMVDLEPARDLWPDMLRRIGSAGGRTVRFNLLDWILAGSVTAALLAFPGLIPGLLYHL
jgi:hypothetical protein